MDFITLVRSNFQSDSPFPRYLFFCVINVRWLRFSAEELSHCPLCFISITECSVKISKYTIFIGKTTYLHRVWVSWQDICSCTDMVHTVQKDISVEKLRLVGDNETVVIWYFICLETDYPLINSSDTGRVVQPQVHNQYRPSVCLSVRRPRQLILYSDSTVINRT